MAEFEETFDLTMSTEVTKNSYFCHRKSFFVKDIHNFSITSGVY